MKTSNAAALVVLETAVVLLLIALFFFHGDVTARQSLLLAVTNTVSALTGLGAGILTGHAIPKDASPLDENK